MPKMIGFSKTIKAFYDRAGSPKRTTKNAYAVGYAAPYAVYVHENLEAFHPVGQAKYLEEPLRRLRKLLGEIVRMMLRRGFTVDQALFRAATRLKEESQALVPVDTGFLRDSAFIKIFRKR